MKKIVCLMALVLMASCAPFKINFNHRAVKTDVYLDSDWSWANRSETISIKSITLRVINKKYVPVVVKVKCEYLDGAKFGEMLVTVKPRNDQMFTVKGFSRTAIEEDEEVSCSISSVKC